MNKLLLLCVLFLPSCGLIGDLQKVAADGKELISEFKDVYAEAKVSADVDKNGKTSSSEWLTWLLGGGAGTALAALIALFKKTASVQAQTDDLYDKHNENKVAIAGAAAPTVNKS